MLLVSPYDVIYNTRAAVVYDGAGVTDRSSLIEKRLNIVSPVQVKCRGFYMCHTRRSALGTRSPKTLYLIWIGTGRSQASLVEKAQF